MTWAQSQAIALCKEIEDVCPEYGCHVALTGGLLYKYGERKDADILFYRIREVEEINVEGLMTALKTRLDIVPERDDGWCYKASYQGKAIDFFFPDREGFYVPGEHK